MPTVRQAATNFQSISSGCPRVMWPSRSRHSFSACSRDSMSRPSNSPTASTTRQGFGSRLISTLVSAESGTPFDMRFEPNGLVCEFDGPLQKRWLG